MNAKKPDIVYKAEKILWATLAIGVLRSIMEFSRNSQQVASAGGKELVIFLTSFTFLIMALLFYFIGKRKNWARWVYMVLSVWGAPFAISPLILSLQHEPFSGFLGIIQMVAQAVALVFLFLAPAREWFKKPRTQPLPNNQ